jgi:hypothetical protein
MANPDLFPQEPDPDQAAGGAGHPGGRGPETDTLHPSPVQKDYPASGPDEPNPQEPDLGHPSVPATKHGFGAKILYDGAIIETRP